MENTESPEIDHFPFELLAQPEIERLAYFKGYTTKHRNLLKADLALWRAIHACISDSIIFIFGPPGVGKSTLCSRIIERLNQQSASATSTEEVPRATALLTEAPPPEKGGFSWKNFYKRSLATLEEPYIASLGWTPQPHSNPRLAPALLFASGLENSEYGLALQRALRQRRPMAFLVDEAQHIGKVPSGRKLQDQMDVIKALASCSSTRLALIGTYELLNLRNLSGQLSRRSINIHFKRYRMTAEDIKSFQSVLWNFQRHLPLTVEPDLLRHWEYCYIHSIGCVGILKDWLTLTLNEALEEKACTITFEMLERTALSIDECESIAYEAVEGEERLSKRGSSSQRLLQLLRLTDGAIAGTKSTLSREDHQEKKDKPPPRLPPPVGRRSPRRDKIGRK